MMWQQVYDPFGKKLLSTAISALPVLTLFFVLIGLKKRVWVAALSGLVMAVALALLVFKMPAVLVTTAAAHGFIFGLLRIAWIVVGSIFLYNVASETGQFQIMKDSIAGLSSDKRLQLVLIAFCFGAFLEGTGGGGAPVAIAGAFLMGLGFSPFQSATLCLLANTAPVAWGGVGESDSDPWRRHTSNYQDIAGSNALFGNLQKVTAEQLSLSPILMGAANSTGGVMDKMIDAQSIVVASSATNQQGQEAGDLQSRLLAQYCLACLVASIVMFYAYVVPWAVPR
jgi:L-lactate permease